MLEARRTSSSLQSADQFPGPTLEARFGDTLEIEIFNFAEEEVSLHWHGLHMRGSLTCLLTSECWIDLRSKGANHMDGPVGITQCAIKHGRKFTYRVPIDDQAGTFWYVTVITSRECTLIGYRYHAHSEV